MLRTLATLLLLVTAPASAQVLSNACQTGLHRLTNHDPAAAAQTLATTLSDIFADGPPSPGLTVYTTLPPTVVPDCPQGAWEPAAQLARLGEGLYTGRIQPTNFSHHGQVFRATVVFTADAILEWKPLEGTLRRPVPGGVLVFVV